MVQPRGRPAVAEAVKAREEGREKVIIFNLSGHGLLDLKGYEMYFGEELSNFELPEEDLQNSLQSIAGHPPAEARTSGRWGS